MVVARSGDSSNVLIEREMTVESNTKGCYFVRDSDKSASNIDGGGRNKRFGALGRGEPDGIRFVWVQ
jgi:hypothetical protein